MTTYLMRAAFHSSDDGVTTDCGLPVPAGAREWDESMAEFPVTVCVVCRDLAVGDALAEANKWLEEIDDVRAVRAVCGVHIVAIGTGDEDVVLLEMVSRLPGSMIVTPTARQIVDMVENVSCERCAIPGGGIS